MNISKTGQVTSSQVQPDKVSPKPSGEGKGFGEIFEQAFDRVNSDMVHADNMIQKMATGKDVDIAQTMIAISKADISFRMMLQVRNKALSAYEEIMRMTV